MQRRGMTRLDLIATAIVVAATMAILLPALGAARPTDRLAGCLDRTLGLSAALLQYADDHGGVLPPGKYGHQGGHPVPKAWIELLYELDYVPDKADFQCPADDVTNNVSLYYDEGPAYPDWWASYAMSMQVCDLFWIDHIPDAAVLATHDGNLETQVLLGESESNSIMGTWFGSGSGSDEWSFRGSYVRQFPFNRHKGFCMYAMLDGRAKAMRVPSSDAVDNAQFETEIRGQFQTCSGEQGGAHAHVCFWNRYRRGLAMTNLGLYH